jgi:hypothetical protein
MADIFISYRDWAFWIAKELEALAHTPRVHEWEMKGSDDIYAWMQERHDAADHVHCVVSDDYLTAPYAARTQRGAVAGGQEPARLRLFVAVKPCKLPTSAITSAAASSSAFPRRRQASASANS